MKQPPSTVVRLPRAAFDTFSVEAVRQCRPLPVIIGGAARAFASLPAPQREEFTIGEPMQIGTAKSLLDRSRPAPANRRKGGAR